MGTGPHNGQRNGKLELAVWALVKQAKVPRIDVCTVCLTWFPPNHRKRDPGALTVMMKAAIDGLVISGVLEDDDARHVAGEHCRIGPVTKPARIELAIITAPDILETITCGEAS